MNSLSQVAREFGSLIHLRVDHEWVDRPYLHPVSAALKLSEHSKRLLDEIRTIVSCPMLVVIVNDYCSSQYE